MNKGANKMKLTKTDIAFYLVMFGSVVTQITENWKAMKSGEPVDWVLVGLIVLGSVIYGFYDYLTDTRAVSV